MERRVICVTYLEMSIWLYFTYEEILRDSKTI